MGGGEEPNQTEFKHLRTIGSRRNGGNLEPIQSHSALADVGPKDVFFGDKKLLLGKKCQKFFHPASETLRQTSDRVQSPDRPTVGSEDSRNW